MKNLEIVLCKDCIHQDPDRLNDGSNCYVCRKGHGWKPDDWFCANGERRENGNDNMQQMQIDVLRKICPFSETCDLNDCCHHFWRLLKIHYEQMHPIVVEVNNKKDYSCPTCGEYFFHCYRFCPQCGQSLQWKAEDNP